MRDTTSPRKIVFYGRVSTEHEAQLSALENQMQWYDDQLRYHSNWTLVRKYIDKGITGTQAKKRPAFLKMIADAENHEFDLIVTREVCRFARNTVDTLVYTRQLKTLGIEVFFVEDNIWTLDGDGEMRLTLMATLAQDESRKISERVRAGQYISRQNEVLYGTGNILGYNRVGDHYEIDEEQAQTVRMIFQMYNSGMGYQKIRTELRKAGRKRSSGDSEWDLYAIARIIKNSTYAGILAYNKSSKPDFLTPREANNDIDTYEYHKSDKIPPIISEEEWREAQKRREERIRYTDTGKKPKRQKVDTWTQRLECSCGSHMRRDTWHKNKTRPATHGYVCYGRLTKGTTFCQMPSIPEWKLELIAKTVIEKIWTERTEAVILAYQWIEEAAAEANNIEETQKKINKLENRLKNYANMRADGELTKEEYLSFKRKTEEELSTLRSEMIDSPVDLEKVKKILNEYIDFSQPQLPKAIVEALIKKVQVIDKDHFIYYVGLDDISAFDVTTSGRTGKCKVTINNNNDDDDPNGGGNTEATNPKTSDETAEQLNRYVYMDGSTGGDQVLQSELMNGQFLVKIDSFIISSEQEKRYKSDAKHVNPVFVDVVIV